MAALVFARCRVVAEVVAAQLAPQVRHVHAAVAARSANAARNDVSNDALSRSSASSATHTGVNAAQHVPHAPLVPPSSPRSTVTGSVSSQRVAVQVPDVDVERLRGDNILYDLPYCSRYARS